MGQLINLLRSLSRKQQISIGIAAAIVIAALYTFTNWHREQDFKPLYTGVAAEEAASIVQKIKESGSEYKLSENGSTISVPSAKVAELRLEMAAAGLPKSGRIGFELFDKANFGATDFVEHVNYNRALEGELERSVDSISAIDHSRVHITSAKDSVFIESREPGKASVIVSLRPGATLFPQNVAAIQQLVSSAVEGLNPDDVSVVDTRGSLLSRRKTSLDGGNDAAYTYRQRLEHDLVEKINGTLEPLLGRDRFRAGVSVDCDLTSSEQSEETYDPTKSVMTNSQKTEEVIAGGATAGIPGTASNLPRPAVRAGGPTSTTSRRTENISYESSHVVRKTRFPEGQVKRLSISVLLDQKVRWEGKGNARKQVLVPPAAETIKAVHDLVAGVTGFTQDRGDQITVESLPFESTLEEVAPEAPVAAGHPLTWKEYARDPKMLIGAGVGVLLLGVIAFMFFKKSRSKAPAKAPTVTPAIEEAKKSTLDVANAAEEMEAALAERIAEQQRADIATLAALKLPAITTKKQELLTKEIRESTKKDPTVSSQVIASWIHES
ncbi:MAG TPA: flagellar basal-body MS-ring/collar protein FliF [Bryobacteraceae bacterium]|jgi:flagellar M-ring protein FliF|nr:flagellar basal-body MS-ring/collar protein FliF [Bryobacteraceae bacterium]